MFRRINPRMTAYAAALATALIQPLRWTHLVLASSIVLTVEQWAAEAAQYYSLEEGLKTVFPEADDYVREERDLTRAEYSQMLELLGGQPLPGPPVVYKAKKGKEIQGYAVVLDEIGKHKPITFMVGVTAEGEVNDLLVMVYRETRGGEIKRKRFLRQFHEKDLSHPLDIRKDIQHVTGATLSSRAATVVVRRALALQKVLYGENGTRLTHNNDAG